MVYTGAHLLFKFFYGIICVAAFLFWIWMLVDMLLSAKPALHKILWGLVMVLVLPPVGSIIYFLAGRGRR